LRDLTPTGRSVVRRQRLRAFGLWGIFLNGRVQRGVESGRRFARAANHAASAARMSRSAGSRSSSGEHGGRQSYFRRPIYPNIHGHHR
jgi:hypothetical protein